MGSGTGSRLLGFGVGVQVPCIWFITWQRRERLMNRPSLWCILSQKNLCLCVRKIWAGCSSSIMLRCRRHECGNCACRRGKSSYTALLQTQLQELEEVFPEMVRDLNLPSALPGCFRSSLIGILLVSSYDSDFDEDDDSSSCNHHYYHRCYCCVVQLRRRRPPPHHLT